jgi:hypothetical protein
MKEDDMKGKKKFFCDLTTPTTKKLKKMLTALALVKRLKNP